MQHLGAVFGADTHGHAQPPNALPSLRSAPVQPTSLVSLLFTYLVPFRYTAPCALVMLGMALHGAAQQCTAYCRSSGVERAAVQLAPGAFLLPAG